MHYITNSSEINSSNCPQSIISQQLNGNSSAIEQNLGTPSKFDNSTLKTCPNQSMIDSPPSQQFIDSPPQTFKQRKCSVDCTLSNASRSSRFTKKSSLRRSSLFDIRQSGSSNKQQFNNQLSNQERQVQRLTNLTKRLRFQSFYLKSRVNIRKVQQSQFAADFKASLNQYFLSKK